MVVIVGALGASAGVALFAQARDRPPQKSRTNMKAESKLEQLFVAQLHYNDQVDVKIPMDERTGDLIGRGDGVVKGQKINGTITWAYYAENCAYLWIKQGQEPPPDVHLCKTNPGGFIKTNDGATIRFDARGYGLRGPDPSRPHVWRLTSALQFHTEDTRYEWLNTALGVWEGEFDEIAGRAAYRALIQLQRGQSAAS
jgi:hypothetical protein